MHALNSNRIILRAHRFLLCATLLIFNTAMNAESHEKAKPVPIKTELATLGGGCFWCVEAVFETLEGVKSVVSGYAGGKTPDPTYEQVCSGTTGHAEVVQIEFDPAKISYAQLLDIFWHAHDPTTLNRQGADVGTHYRSIILYHDEAQKEAAGKSKTAAARQLSRPVVTEIVPLTKFYRAEDYHQDYFAKNPNASYCVYVIRPKLEKLEESKKIPATRR